MVRATAARAPNHAATRHRVANADRRRAKEEERGPAQRAAGVASRNETTPERSQVAPFPSKARRGTHLRFRVSSSGQRAAMSFIEASLSLSHNL